MLRSNGPIIHFNVILGRVRKSSFKKLWKYGYWRMWMSMMIKTCQIPKQTTFSLWELICSKILLILQNQYLWLLFILTSPNKYQKFQTHNWELGNMIGKNLDKPWLFHTRTSDYDGRFHTKYFKVFDYFIHI